MQRPRLVIIEGGPNGRVDAVEALRSGAMPDSPSGRAETIQSGLGDHAVLLLRLPGDGNVEMLAWQRMWLSYDQICCHPERVTINPLRVCAAERKKAPTTPAPHPLLPR
jgi:hypothetical protein